MSTAAAAAVPPPTTTASPSNYLASIGLGYSISIAFGFLVLLSTILLSSYICCRASRRRSSSSSTTATGDGGIILPRIIFVAEDDEIEAGGADDGESVVVGLDQAVINSYPKFQFSKDAAAAASHGGCGGGDATCSICLCEYKEAEMLRMMPECRHYFHLCCLDAWLKLNGSCPVCRNSPLPTPQTTPLSTPLSEVVPLSQYAADRRRTSR